MLALPKPMFEVASVQRGGPVWVERYRTLCAHHNPDRDAEGPGGTSHLVREARKWGFKPLELDARELLA